MKIALEIIFAVWAACGWVIVLRLFRKVVELEKQIERNVSVFREFEEENRRVWKKLGGMSDLCDAVRLRLLCLIFGLVLALVYLWKKGGFKFK